MFPLSSCCRRGQSVNAVNAIIVQILYQIVIMRILLRIRNLAKALKAQTRISSILHNCIYNQKISRVSDFRFFFFAVRFFLCPFFHDASYTHTHTHSTLLFFCFETLLCALNSADFFLFIINISLWFFFVLWMFWAHFIFHVSQSLRKCSSVLVI